MPVSTITPRLICKEDLNRTTTRGETTTAEVLGAGLVTLNKVDLWFLSDYTAAANDAAAAAAGVEVFEIYYNTTRNKLKARAS